MKNLEVISTVKSSILSCTSFGYYYSEKSFVDSVVDTINVQNDTEVEMYSNLSDTLFGNDNNDTGGNNDLFSDNGDYTNGNNSSGDFGYSDGWGGSDVPW